MDKLLRFSDYDVFAYLASGFTALAGWDLLFSSGYVIGAQWSASSGTLTIVAAYVIGQIIASPAAWIIERQFVRRVLGHPTAVLLRSEPLSGWRKWASHFSLAEYYRPLETNVADRLRAFMMAKEISSSEGLFWQAFSVAKASPSATARMDAFLKLYGFCRNIAFVAFATGLGLATKLALHCRNTDWDDEAKVMALYSSITFLIAVGMLFRYLKFHRLFSVEVLVTFANSLEEEPARA
ncbi:MAG: hypothetical protein RIC85_01015 [Gammaproteobacteria bacterium]